ncbi:NACHT, LRR and PYD domains-containing protein 3 [Oryzias melastigma]|uniref:NACHT, LRR and PYD domains-containing protein 3-like n=1 Tax=Oryzias melastigma TaxID=30732 RepID=A0A3B3BBE5_ORYME|nr:NACHT, LRR and PYD domains-containing protein 3 [Oryzias melastigma]
MDEENSIESMDSSPGDAVSGRDDGEFDEDEEIYDYERRPSLDLEETPMETFIQYHVDPVLPPALSYTSLNSQGESEMNGEDESITEVKLDRTGSFSSCYSYDSDDCEKKINKSRSKDDTSESAETDELILDENEFKHQALTVPFTFRAISDTVGKLSDHDKYFFGRELWLHFPQKFSVDMDLVDVVDKLLECFNLEKSLQIVKAVLVKIERNKLVQFLKARCMRNEVRYELKKFLREKYSDLFKTCSDDEKPSFSEAFTDLYISSNRHNGPNIEHEVLNIPKLNTIDEPDAPVPLRDLLNPDKLSDIRSNVIMLCGVAGSGKSMAIKKLIYDWVENDLETRLDFVIPIAFTELKQFEGSKMSFLEVLHNLYPPTERLTEKELGFSDCKTLFLFDGLDEYERCDAFNFNSTELVFSSTHTVSLHGLVVNVLRGKVLENGVALVTTRPMMTSTTPWDNRHHKIEMLGFTNNNREEFFKKRFKNATQANRVIEYVKSSKTLHAMCHLPLFCSIVADECQGVFREKGMQAELPRSITYMYTKLLLSLIRESRKSRAPDRSPDQETEFLITHGKAALTMLEECTFKKVKPYFSSEKIFNPDSVTYSGLVIEYTVTPAVLLNEQAFSFIHPTVQEYLVALYAYLSFQQNHNIFETKQSLQGRIKGLLKPQKVMDVFMCAVEKSLEFEDGRFDMCLRFLCGMELKANQDLLQSFCGSSSKTENHIQSTAAFIKKKMKEDRHQDRINNLKRCLEEMGVST